MNSFIKYSASFKNFPFLTSGTSGGVSKSIVINEYLDSNKNDIIDLGNNAEDFKVEAYIVASALGDAIDTAIEFKKVLASKGTGELIHPYWGSKIVQVKSFSQGQENIASVKFSIAFVEKKDAELQPFNDVKEASEIRQEVTSINKKIIDEKLNLNGYGNYPARSLDAFLKKIYQLTANVLNDLDYKNYNLIKKIAENLSKYKSNPLALLEETFQAGKELDYFHHFLKIPKQAFDKDDLAIERKLKEQKNIVAELMKLNSLASVLKTAKDLQADELDFYIHQTKLILSDLFIKELRELFRRMKSLFHFYKNKFFLKTYKVTTKTPLVVIAQELGRDVEELAKVNRLDDINEVEGRIIYV